MATQQTETTQSESGNGKLHAATVKLRKKSKESELKLRMRAINRELKQVEKRVTEFEALKKEMAGTDKRKADLTAELGTIKTDLIKELGLA
jgi:hypothetical protein